MKSLIVSLAVTVLILSVPKNAYGFSGAGSGTETDPYIITDVNQLQEMQGGLNAYYELGNDVNAFDTVNWNGGQGFLPVGDSAHGFAGHFDGKGLTIEGLFINRPTSDNIGLFGALRIAIVKDVTLVDPNISGNNYTGSLVGYKSEGTIVGCSAYQPTVTSTGDNCGGLLGYQTGTSGSVVNCRCYDARVTGRNYVGGLAGYNSEGSINDCFANDVIVTGSDSCGGLVGSWSYSGGNLTNSHSSGTVTGTSNVGGLVGYCYYGIILSNCSSEASVTGSGDSCGGLVGWLYYSTTVTDCYATGRVVGNNYVGGLVGYAYYGNSLSTCYATGSVWGFEQVGGLVGANNSSNISKSYSSGSIVNGGKYVGGCVGYHQSGTISRCFSTSDANVSGIDCGGFVGKSDSAITDCFATGKAGGYDFVGGFAGETANTANTTNCYSTGPVTATFNFGGFAGYNSGSWSACFWDTETSGVGISGCGTGKTTAEMMQRATFDPPWNFATIWGIDEGNTYPYLMELYPICGDPWHPYPIGDLNYDCIVNMLDFAAFANHWLECTAPECD